MCDRLRLTSQNFYTELKRLPKSYIKRPPLGESVTIESTGLTVQAEQIDLAVYVISGP